MLRWSKALKSVSVNPLSRQHQAEAAQQLKPGIDLSLQHLIDMQHNNILQWMTATSRVKSNLVGGFQSRFRGRGMDFDESRLYQPGDDVRSIDWKVTARTGDPHTKIYKEERERPVFTLLDLSPSLFFGSKQAFKSVIACELAAQFMWNALQRGDRYGALGFSHHRHWQVKPSANRRSCMRLLNRMVEEHQLALKEIFSPDSFMPDDFIQDASIQETLSHNTTQPQLATENLNNALNRLHFLAKPGSLVHIISDFNQFDKKCEKRLSRLSQHLDIHCVLISDPIEQNLPPQGIYGISDGHSQAVLNTHDSQARNHYQQSFLRKLESVRNFTLRHRGYFNHLNTSYQQLTNDFCLANKSVLNKHKYPPPGAIA